LKILSFETVDSTQTYLLDAIRSKRVTPPIAIWAKRQSSGIGSRDNRWEDGEGNLFFSFAIDLDSLPQDLPLPSASIYFAFLMKEVLAQYVQGVWLKWPNDLYYNDKKIGGIITTKVGSVVVCGMGVNLQKNANGYEALNLNIEREVLLESYFSSLKKSPNWKEVFSKYAIEFERRKSVSAHIQGEYKSLRDAILREDGSLIIDNKRVYSLR